MSTFRKQRGLFAKRHTIRDGDNRWVTVTCLHKPLSHVWATAEQQSFICHSAPQTSKCIYYRYIFNILRSLFLLLFVLLSGDIELNPGPSALTLSTLNIRSILHPLHSTALSDLIDTHNPDLFCLTETWIKPITTAAELLNCTPPHYSLLSTPRNSFNKNSSSGGGTAFLIREPFTQLPTSVPDFSSFESSSVTLQLSHSKLSVFNIYRPPSSLTHSKPFSVFLDDFSSFLSSAATTPHEFIITGDFNIYLDNHADTLTSQFLSLLSSFNLSQHSTSPHTTKVTFLI